HGLVLHAMVGKSLVVKVIARDRGLTGRVVRSHRGARALALRRVRAPQHHAGIPAYPGDLRPLPLARGWKTDPDPFRLGCELEITGEVRKLLDLGAHHGRLDAEVLG